MSSEYTDTNTPVTSPLVRTEPKKLRVNRKDWRSDAVSTWGCELNLPCLLYVYSQYERALACLRKIRSDESKGGGPKIHVRILQEGNLPDTPEYMNGPTSKFPVFERWLRQSWVNHTGAVGVNCVENGPEFTILTLVIPDEDLAPADAEMYPASEVEEEGEVNTGPGNDEASAGAELGRISPAENDTVQSVA